MANQKYFYKVHTYVNIAHMDIENILNSIAQEGCRIINIDTSPRITYITAEYDYEQWQALKLKKTYDFRGPLGTTNFTDL